MHLALWIHSPGRKPFLCEKLALESFSSCGFENHSISLLVLAFVGVIYVALMGAKCIPQDIYSSKSLEKILKRYFFEVVVNFKSNRGKKLLRQSIKIMNEMEP